MNDNSGLPFENQLEKPELEEKALQTPDESQFVQDESLAKVENTLSLEAAPNISQMEPADIERLVSDASNFFHRSTDSSPDGGYFVLDTFCTSSMNQLRLKAY